MSFDAGSGGGFWGDVGDAFSSAGNWLSNTASSLAGGISDLFSGGSTGAAKPGETGFASFSTPAGSTQQPSSQNTPVSANNILASLGQSSAPVSTNSAISVGGQTLANPAILAQEQSTNFYQDDASKGTPPGTLQQISDALGLKQALTPADVLKGLASAGMLGYGVFKGSQTSPAQKQIESLASQQSAQGQQLAGYLTSGTLPPGAKEYLNATSAAQKAAIRSKYAQLGMSGSTAEMQELNGVDSQAMQNMFQIETELYNSGVNETSSSGKLYELLMEANNQDNNAIGSAIQNFVSSLGGAKS